MACHNDSTAHSSLLFFGGFFVVVFFFGGGGGGARETTLCRPCIAASDLGLHCLPFNHNF